MTFGSGLVGKNTVILAYKTKSPYLHGKHTAVFIDSINISQKG
jgi:hypothetical protein